MILDDRIFRTSPPRRTDPARLVLVTAPAVEVWTTSDSEVTQMLKRDDTTADDAFVTLCLQASRQWFERITGLALITQEWRLELDRTPTGREIEIPRAPMLAVTHIKYKAETTGTLTTWDSASYTLAGVGIPGAPGRVWCNDEYDWPSLGSYPGALQLTFTAGFGAAATAVPADIKAALLFLAAHWYENRLPVNVGNIVNEMPLHLQSLVEMHRVSFLG